MRKDQEKLRASAKAYEKAIKKKGKEEKGGGETSSPLLLSMMEFKHELVKIILPVISFL